MVQLKWVQELVRAIFELHRPLDFHIEAAGIRYRLESLLQRREGLMVLELLVTELAQALLFPMVHLQPRA